MNATLSQPTQTDRMTAIVNWLRFGRDLTKPCFIADIERATGIKLTPSLISEGDRTGAFRYSQPHRSII
jgi:hypothetical protein